MTKVECACQEGRGGAAWLKLLWRLNLRLIFLFFKKIAYSFIFGCAGSLLLNLAFLWGFPHSSVGKESACNAGNPSSIPGSGRSAGEGIGYPLQYSWASLVAQLVKNPPAKQETWVRSLGWEVPLKKKGKATIPVFWPGESHGQSMGSQRVRHDWVTFTFTFTWPFSSCGKWGLLPGCSVHASHCGSFSCYRTWVQ